MVPRKYSVNPKLGLWVLKQRSNFRLYQEGKPSPMTAERILVLESISFEWATTRGFYDCDKCANSRWCKGSRHTGRSGKDTRGVTL